MPLNKKELQSFQHPSEFSRFLIAALVSTTLSIFVILFLIGIGVTSLVIVGGLFLFIWFISEVTIEKILKNLVRVSKNSFSDVFKTLNEAKDYFGYEKHVDVYVIQDGTYTANLLLLLSKRKILLIDSDILTSSDANELRFLVGKFIGALASKHYRFVWVQLFINSVEKLVMLNIFMFPYERATQYTSDQLGLKFIDGDIKAAVNALLKTIIGKDITHRVNMGAFLEQGMDSKSNFIVWFTQIISPIPHVTDRVTNIIRFSIKVFPVNSKKYLDSTSEETKNIIFKATKQ